MFGRLAVIIGSVLVMEPATALSLGKEVTIHLRSGAEMSGEILVVRESSLIFCGKFGLKDATLETDNSLLEVVPIGQIIQVSIEGKSYIGIGLARGLVAGVVAGWLVGSSQTEEPRNIGQAIVEPLERAGSGFVGALLGALGGSALGIAVGGAFSVSDQRITANTPGWMAVLKRSARYPDAETEYLQSVR